MTRRAARRVALALLIVLAAVAGPMTGSAAADPTISTNCGFDDAVRGIYSTVDPEVDCGIYDDSAETATAQDAYANSLALADSRDAYITTRHNLANDLRGVLWMKGKAAAIRALNNGSTEAEMQAAFNESVYDHASQMVRNDIRRQTAAANQLKYLSAMTGGTNTTVGANVNAYASLYTVWYRLPNGEYIRGQLPMDDGGQLDSIAFGTTYSESQNDRWDPGEIARWNRSWEHGSISATANKIQVGNATSSAPYNRDNQHTVPAMNSTQSADAAGQVIDQANQVTQNGQVWVSEAYAAYEAGNVTAAELWDPVTLAQEASTDYDSTGYYSFANSELSAIGLTGDVNTSHIVDTQVTISSYNGGPNGTNASYETTTYNATLEGTLFISGPDSMSLETGQTYDPATLSGTVYMTIAESTDRDTGDPINGTGSRIELTEPFTIRDATNVNTGESVNVTNAEDKDYSTANASRLQEQIDRLIAERRALEDARSRQTSDESQTAGAGFPWPDSQQGPVFIIATILLAIVLLSVFKNSRP